LSPIGGFDKSSPYNYDTVSWREGIEGRGQAQYLHPHPNPLPSREREEPVDGG